MVHSCESRDENCFVPRTGHQNKAMAGRCDESDTDECLGLRTMKEPLKGQHQLHQLCCLGAWPPKEMAPGNPCEGRWHGLGAQGSGVFQTHLKIIIPVSETFRAPLFWFCLYDKMLTFKAYDGMFISKSFTKICKNQYLHKKKMYIPTYCKLFWFFLKLSVTLHDGYVPNNTLFCIRIAVFSFPFPLFSFNHLKTLTGGV